MKEKVGKTAGKVWQTLRDKGELEISRLPRMLNEKTVVVYQALGWLAREDKLHYRTKSGKIYVSLTVSEKNL
jgi:hypothetical protein